MGKAIIQSGGTDGQYTIKILLDRQWINQRIAEIDRQITDINNIEIVQAQADLLEAENTVNDLTDRINDAINDWDSKPDWEASADKSYGDLVKIGTFAVAEAQQAGRTGSVEPEWPDGHNETIRENHVIWNVFLDDLRGGTWWSRRTNYSVGQEVLAVSNHSIVEGNPKNLYAVATQAGRSGLGPPPWSVGTVIDGGIIWRRLDSKEAVNELLVELLKATVVREKAQTKVDEVTLLLASLRKEKDYLKNNMPDDPIVTAWCADLTTDLATDIEIGTIEIPGERKDIPVIIQPGFVDLSQEMPGADYLDTRDGGLQPSISARGITAVERAARVFYNWALLPGWQKWKPTYRLGAITALSGDTCTVALDAATSSSQALYLNQSEILTDVPIRYMNCNGAAFETGDRVVVSFEEQDWSQPVVIGFESAPKACPGGFLCLPKSNTQSLNQHILRFVGSNWIAKESSIAAGSVNWYGNYIAAISWKGSPARNIAPDPQKTGGIPLVKLPFVAIRDTAGDEGALLRYVFQSFDTGIWINGTLYPGPGDNIVGASVQVISGIPWVNCITTDNIARQDTFWRRLLSDTNGTWTQLITWTRPAEIGLHMAGWFFNASGNEASCVLPEYFDNGSGQILYKPSLWSVTFGGSPSKITGGSDLEKTTNITANNDCNETESASSTSSGTYSGSGNRVIAVDYQGDTRTTANYIYDFSGTREKSYSGFATWTYSRSDSTSGGQKITIGAKTVSMSAFISALESASLSNVTGKVEGTITNDFENIDSLILYLDLRHNQAIIYEEYTDSLETWTADGPPADKFNYALNQTINRRIYILSSNQILLSDQEIITDTATINDPNLLAFCGEDTTINTVVKIEFSVEAGSVGYDESTAGTYSQINNQGRLFVSVPGISINSRLSGNGIHLDDGDPVALTGLSGPNPRFNPILLV